MYEQRETMGEGSIKIMVVPIETLIAMKEEAGRPQHIADVYHLRQIRDEK